MKKIIAYIFILLMLLFIKMPSWGQEACTLSVTGAVRQPLNLTLQNLSSLQSVEAQSNGIFKDGRYRGVFRYRGVPLRDLLEMAAIEKGETDFKKPVDLAILVRDKAGKQVVLSWGEVFYRNPGRILVATSGEPVLPRRDCSKCHAPKVFEPRLNQLHRKIGYPKLVMAGDGFVDRSLENITIIRAVDVAGQMPKEKEKRLYAPAFVVAGAVKEPKTFRNLGGFTRKTVKVRLVGEGDGYHGMKTLTGVSLRDILHDVAIAPLPDQAFLASAPDGYRALFSYGEIFLDPHGDRFVVADHVDGEPATEGGAFILAAPDDLMASRQVKALSRIEVISLRKEPKIHIIGVGCGDTELITLEAISQMAAVDAFVCPPDISRRFGKYMGDKPILTDLYTFAPPVLKRKNPDLSADALSALMAEKRQTAAEMIKTALHEGKSVGILEYGDPTIWSGSRWLQEIFHRDRVQVTPGLSSFNVSNALMKTDVGCNGAVILATPGGLKENPALVKSLAGKGETLCLFMGLKDLDNLVNLLTKWYPPKTPAALIYKAGYSAHERIIAGTLENLAAAASQEKEKFLALIYVGPCVGAQETWQCR